MYSPLVAVLMERQTAAWQEEVQQRLNGLNGRLETAVRNTGVPDEEVRNEAGVLSSLYDDIRNQLNKGKLDFSIRLVQPIAQPPKTQAVTPTFVNVQRQQATLLETTLLPSPTITGTVDKAIPQEMAWLMTTWQLDRAMQTQLLQTPATMPALFIHFVDAAGAVIGQADHPLGEHYLLFVEGGQLYDFVPLPALDDLATLTVALGLWYPATAEYFWQPNAAQGVDPTTVQVGSLRDIMVPLQEGGK